MVSRFPVFQILSPSAMTRLTAISSALPVRDFLLKQAQGDLSDAVVVEGAVVTPPEDGEQLGILALVAVANGFRDVALSALHGLKDLRSPSLRSRVYTDVVYAQLLQVRI